MKLKRAEKYGFCAGVRLADMKVRRFAAEGNEGAILGQVVHNERVVAEMEELGVRTVDSLDEVAEGTIVFSAHGVAPSVQAAARRRGLHVLDTTCPFVYDIHDEAERARRDGEHLVFIGDPQHREVIGYTRDLPDGSYHVLSTIGEAEAVDWRRYPSTRIFFQTTLNASDYEDVVAAIEGRSAGRARRTDSICYATKENQDAAVALASDPEIDLVLVIGGRKSANTRHLWESCQRLKPSYLIHDASDLKPEWFAGADGVGITAGASTPESMIEEVESAVARLAGAP